MDSNYRGYFCRLRTIKLDSTEFFYGENMSQITIKNLSFGYGSNQIFDDVSLDFDTNFKLGLVGRNGYGKTTFLNILQNKLDYQGSISSPVNFNYFPLDIKDENLSVIENLTNQNIDVDWQLYRELNYLNLDPLILERKFSSISGGEKTKVLLALAFVNEDDFVLLDEPTNHLDLSTRKIITEYLNSKRQGYIVISHDKNLINQVTDHTLVIDKIGIHLYHGNYQTYIDQTKMENESQLAKNKKVKQEISRLKSGVQQKKGWSLKEEAAKRGAADKGFVGAQAARMMKRSKAIERRMENKITEKEALLKNVEEADQLSLISVPVHQEVLVEAKDFGLAYPEQPLFEKLNFQIKPGEIVALTGDNGSGKSTLIKQIIEESGEDLQITGNLAKIQNLKISLVQQDAKYFGNLSNFAKNHNLNYEELLHVLRQLGLSRDKFQTPIEAMSMGEQKRVELAKSLITPAQLFIWDEPLNYLDIYNADQIVEMIKRLQPTMLVIEHDRDFIDAIKTAEIKIKK